MGGMDYFEGYDQGIRDAHRAIGEAPFGWVGKVECQEELGRLVKECREYDMRLVMALLDVERDA